MDTFFGAVVHGILLGGIYCLVALGVLVIYKSSRVFNMAHGEIMVFLAFLTWWFVVSAGIPIWLALPLVVVSSALLGLIFNRFLIRPVIGRPMLVTFMITLLLGIALKGIAIIIWGGLPQAFPDFMPEGNLNVGGVSFSYTTLISFVIAIFMFGVFVLYFRYTRMGFAMRCVSEDNHISRSLGIDVKRIFALSWVIGCIAAAVGGVLLGSVYAVDTSIGEFGIIRALPVLLLGGLESIPGTLIGAIMIGVTEVLASTYIDPHVPGFRELLPFVMMVLILMVRPQGLFGQKSIERI